MNIKKFTPATTYTSNTSKKELQEIIAHRSRVGILKAGNSKLGKDVFDFSLPPIDSCPDSVSCALDCYAVRYYNQYPNVKKFYDGNFKLVLNDLDTFKKMVINQVKKKNDNPRAKSIKTIRIHASGDFFSMDYLKAWLDICNELKEVQFFAYTKAFNKIDATPGNLNIINSWVEVDGFKYLNFGEYEQIKQLNKKLNGLICPVTIGKKIDCSTCRYCFTRNKVLFVAH